MEQRAGGKGANQAVAIARAGAMADMVGAVGTDGQWVYAHLKSLGVNVDGVEVVKDSTGRAIIQLSENGENCIILYKGANHTTLPPPTKLHPDTTHILLQNEIAYNATLSYLNYENGTSQSYTTIFNPSPMPSRTELKTFPWHKLSWLLLNEVECADLYDVLGNGDPITGNVNDTASYAYLPAYSIIISLLPLLPISLNIVCTIGPDGVLASTNSGQNQRDAIIYLPSAPLQGPARDTTGAGDCFTGYLVAGLMGLEDERRSKGMTSRGGPSRPTRDEIIKVLRRSIQAAGMCVEKRGAMDSIPLGTDVDERLRQQEAVAAD